jgi:hypothetical protein
MGTASAQLTPVTRNPWNSGIHSALEMTERHESASPRQRDARKVEETKMTKMTKISQRRDIADVGHNRAPAKHDGSLNAAELDRVAAAGGDACGGHGGNADRLPGRN